MAGRPSKFGSVNKDAVKMLCQRGFTDDEIVACLHVSQKTWNNWKKKNKDFYESILDWKSVADDKVEHTLSERACGWTDQDGKQYPPDTTAIIFWLKNRRPDQWRDKSQLELHTKQVDDILRGIHERRRSDK